LTNPYAPPHAELRKPAPASNWFLDALTFGVPVFLCALHALAFVGVISLAWIDDAIRGDPIVRQTLARPLIYLQPLCTLATGLLLLLRRRLALIGACGFPIVILAHALYYGTGMPTLYLTCASFLAVYVMLLAGLRKLK
jgi:hypothetical protein